MGEWRWIPLCACIGGLSLTLTQWFIWRYAPIESQLGVIQKIFYIHLPLAWWAFISFLTTCISGILYLWRHRSFWDALAGAAAEIGWVFCTLTLITGSIWARSSWNTWWTWDPRLTTALILWFLYAGYLLLRNMDLPETRRATLCAVVGIVAFIDVPLVFLSARLWRSIHPAVFAAKGGGLEPEMLTTVFIALIAMGFFWFALLLLRTRQSCIARSLQHLAFHE